MLKLQRIIYNASKGGNIRKVRRFQHLLINTYEAKSLAIRRVTQDNYGKKTAGVDGVKSLTPFERERLLFTLSVPRRSKPLRRIWIPKPGKKEMRPLGIPTIHDRCLQALFTLILEPEWEAKFEPNSYGFRPGRGARDALAAIKGYLVKRSKYVIDADIAQCFDTIDHEALLDKVGMKGDFRKQLLYWLKSGVLDGKVFAETNKGTPPCGVISPLLANIALHGLEHHLQDFVMQFPMVYQAALIAKLNPIIRGWANYFGAFDSNTMHFLTKQDYLMYLKLRKWFKRVTGSCVKGNKYFITIGKNKWTFGIYKGPVLLNHWKFATPGSKIIKVLK